MSARIEQNKNEHGHIATPFDGKKALIIGDHPHADTVAMCMGCDKLNVSCGFGLYFSGENGDFYVMDKKHLKWL